MEEKESQDYLFRNAPDKVKKLLSQHRKEKRLKERRDYKAKFLKHGNR